MEDRTELVLLVMAGSSVLYPDRDLPRYQSVLDRFV